MIHNAITALLLGLCIAAFIQPNASRFFAAAAFVSITLLHEILFFSYDGLLYYGTAALFDLGVIILLSALDPVPKMALSLQKVCMVSIYVNAAGWLMWFSYAPPTLYNAAFIALYSWAVMVLIKRSGNDVGGFALGRGYFGLRLYSSSRCNYYDHYEV